MGKPKFLTGANSHEDDKDPFFSSEATCGNAWRITSNLETVRIKAIFLAPAKPRLTAVLHHSSTGGALERRGSRREEGSGLERPGNTGLVQWEGSPPRKA
jgi:hypothetical protein